jgi:exopolyphosphatase / guanosine-5'-triphosphate,3'-diphosphate pyrophosphatase
LSRVPASVRAACIDIGSNTTRLLVADRDDRGLVEVHQERAFTRIGHGLGPAGEISEVKIREVVAVVLAQIAVARDQGVEHVRGVATAAIRTATNGAALIEAIARDAGLTVEILSGEEEARLAFLGAAATLEREPSGPLGVIDVGGGSSELVVGTAPDRVGWWSSVQLGSGALTERWLASDPPLPAQLDAARGEIAAALAGLAPPCPALAVAVGGSATSLARLAGPVLDADVLERSLRVLTAESAAVVAGRFLIDSQRARLLPAGLLILQAMAQLLGAELTVGRGGIREGVLLEALTP